MQHQQQLDDFWQRLATITQDSGSPALWKLSGDFADFLAANRDEAVDWEYEAAQQGAESNGVAVGGGLVDHGLVDEVVVECQGVNLQCFERGPDTYITINVTGSEPVNLDAKAISRAMAKARHYDRLR